MFLVGYFTLQNVKKRYVNVMERHVNGHNRHVKDLLTS